MKVFYKIENNKPKLICLPPDKYVEFIEDDGNLLPNKFYFKHKHNTKIVCLAERISDSRYEISWIDKGSKERNKVGYSLTDVYEYTKEGIWIIIE